MTQRRTMEILAGLRRGGLVIAGRQTGKTTALLMLAHEFGSGNCAVLCHRPEFAWCLKLMWQEMYHSEPSPDFFSDHRKVGAPVKWILVDELSKCNYRGDFFAATDSGIETRRTVMLGDGGSRVEISP